MSRSPNLPVTIAIPLPGFYRKTVDKKPKTDPASSAVAVFDAQIADLAGSGRARDRHARIGACRDHDHPYTGRRNSLLRLRAQNAPRSQADPTQLALRFEGVPGNTCRSIGEKSATSLSPKRAWRSKRVTSSQLGSNTAATCMSVSTPICVKRRFCAALIACFQEIDGVPWAVVTDNMKTAVLGRTAKHEPIWNPAYQKLAVECKFIPWCTPASGNQKGAVENLVKFMKGNFWLDGTFYDDIGSGRTMPPVVSQVNTERPSDATGATACRLA